MSQDKSPGTHDEDLFEEQPQASAEEEVASESVEEVVETPLAKAERERDEFRDQFLRLAAEMENFRKRTARERDDERKYASYGLLYDLLPALDNLQRGIDAAGSDDSSENVLTGVQMVLKQFDEILKRHGVESIASLGEQFDPNFHEALQQRPDGSVPPMTVVQELERGYKLHERVLRPSKVIVSSQPAGE
ncbi:nucleotide exchange factor GrpE [Thalassoglobus sp. JC818]|uniref:nucleotide exchange factor GrpE n=1 Tax=Thalassoglobus sp. JC818 TaxID=3232136 RepID=UPI003459F447